MNWRQFFFCCCLCKVLEKLLKSIYLDSYVYYLTTSAFWECSVKHSKWDYFFSNLLTYEEFFVVSPLRFLSQSGNSPWKSEIYLNWPSFKHTHIWKSVEKCLNLRRWIFSLGLVGCQNTKDVHLTKGCHELKTPKLEWKKIFQLFTNNLWFFFVLKLQYLRNFNFWGLYSIWFDNFRKWYVLK